jgi:hypothetical protein
MHCEFVTAADQPDAFVAAFSQKFVNGCDIYSICNESKLDFLAQS